MTFISIEYIVFLPVICVLYALIPGNFRWVWLLIVSYAFYATWKAPYLLVVLAAVTLFTYACGLGMDSSSSSSRRRKVFLFAGILGNILILIFMKYLSFILENINALAEHVGAHPITLLWTPVSVGVSFFVFQAVGYLVEVYLEVQVPERHLGQFALSLAFFPKLIQGLIEHCGNLVRQFRNPRPVDYNLVRSGPLLLGVGVFKKLVIADRFGLLVDNVYGNFRSPDIEA